MKHNNLGNSFKGSVKSIDFSTFKVGSRYEIMNPRNGEILRYTTIGHFRRGIAIATDSNCDYLINIDCEIIFTPMARYGTNWTSCKPRIKREMGGNYVVSAYKDISAPGKDSNFQGPFLEQVLNEYGVEFKSVYKGIPRSSESEKNDLWKNYPMDIPYERGKIVKYENKFYDLETYELLFSCSESPTFSVDSEFVNGVCRVHDEKYFKKLLVEIKDGDIISFSDISKIPPQIFQGSEETRKQILSKVDKEVREFISNNYQFDLYKYSTTLDQENIQNLSDIPILQQILKETRVIHDSVQRVHGLNWKLKLNYQYKEQIVVEFYEHFYIIKIQNRPKGVNLYDLTGRRLNKNGYSSLYLIKDTSYLKINNGYFLKFDMGWSTIGILEICLKNENTIIYERYFHELNFERAHPADNYRILPYNFLDNNNFEQVAITTDHYSKRPLIEREYYDLSFNKLKKIVTDKALTYETIIKNYLYRTSGGQSHTRKHSKDFIIPHKESTNVIISSQDAVEKTLKIIREELEKGNDYVTHIFKYELSNSKINDSDSTFYIFEYEPYGTMNTKGEISYRYEDPDKVVL